MSGDLFGCLFGAPHEHWSKDDADCCDREFDPPPMTKEQRAAHRAALAPHLDGFAAAFDPNPGLIEAILLALPEDALTARMALSLLALKLKANVKHLKGLPDRDACTLTRHHAKEES